MTPHFVGVTQLAKELEVSPNSIYKALEYGRIQRHENGKFNLEETKKSWRENTHPFRGGKRQEPTDPPHIKHKAAINFWLNLFNDSAGPTAILLRQETDLTPKEVWHFMALSFLIQWEILAGIYAEGEDLPLELSGVAEMLANDEGQRELELWLKNSTCSP